MKRLLIMRHAKSQRDNPTFDDFNRPLLTKGVNRTKRVIAAMIQYDLIPEQIICSPALRTRNTAHLVLDSMGLNENILIEEKCLYFNGEDNYFNAVFACPNEKNTLLIVGHNPMITSFVNFFLTEKIDNLPTSGLIGLAFECDRWEYVIHIPYTEIVRFFPKKMK